MEMRILGFIMVGVIALLAGCHTLDGELVSDDFVLMEASERVGVVRMFTSNWLGERGAGGFYRPMALAAWKLDHLIHGRNPSGYHFTNLMLHLAVSLMVFLLIGHFHRSPWIPLAAASLFAVHPVHVEAVAWISGRTDTVAALFYLLSILCFLHASREETRGSGASVTALVSGIFAMLSKEIAYTLPVTLFVMSRLTVPENGSRLKRRTTLPYFISLAAILVVRALSLGSVLGGYGAGKHLRFDAVIFNYLTFYMQWLLEPFSLPGSAAAPVWTILIWSSFAVSLIALASPVYRPGIIWFWITVLPVLNICRAQYIYLPSIGLFWFVAVVVFSDKNADEQGISDLLRAAGWICLLMIFLTHTWNKNREWSRTGWVGKGVGQVFLAVRPVVPSGSRHVVIDPPVNSKINIGVFQNGIREAVCLWYDDPYLEGVRFASVGGYVDPNPAKDVVWKFEEGRIIYYDDARMQAEAREVPWPGFGSPVEFPMQGSLDLPGFDKVVSGVVICSQLANADSFPDNTPVAEVQVEFAEGRIETHALVTGKHTAEWAYDRPDVRQRIRHQRAPVSYSYLAGEYPSPPETGHVYRGVFMFEIPGVPIGLRIRSSGAAAVSPAASTSGQGNHLEIRSISGVI